MSSVVKSTLKRYKFPILMLVLSTVVSVALPEKAPLIISSALNNFAEMLSVLPPIFLLMGLMDIWVPREAFVKYMGEHSGVIGISLAVFIGAFAAGPLYGAFPVASMMLRKGASIANVMVLLGAWSTLKIPMFLFETVSLGAAFSVTRWVTNIPVIIIMSRIITALLKPNEKEWMIKRQEELCP